MIKKTKLPCLCVFLTTFLVSFGVFAHVMKPVSREVEALSVEHSQFDNGFRELGRGNSDVEISKIQTEDVQTLLENLFNSVSNARDGSSSSKFTRVEYPVLYVMVDFLDTDFVWDESIHRQVMFGDRSSAKDFWQKNFHQNVSIVNAPESNGVNNGMVRLDIAATHPNLTDNSELSQWVAHNLSESLSAWVDAPALDKNFDGLLSQDELSVLFILAGNREQGGGFAVPFNISVNDNEALFLDGVKVHGFAVIAEQTYPGQADLINQKDLFSTVSHELGHLFGATDKYFYDDVDAQPFETWSIMDSAFIPDWDQGDGYSPNLMALDKLETGLMQSGEITSSGVYQSNGISNSTAPNGVISEAKRVWLDPYKVRSSVLLEYRDGSGYDEPIGNEGVLAVAVESLASSSAFDESDTRYRKGVMLKGTGNNGALATGEGLFDLSERVDTPGYAQNPVWPADVASIVVDSGSGVSASLSVDLQTYGPDRGHLRYDRAGTSGVNGEDSDLLASPGYASGYGGDLTGTGESVTKFYNDTNFDVIDGFEVFLDGEANVTISFYEDVVDNQPYNLLSTETFKFSGEGWVRAFLENPVDFGRNSYIAFSVTVERTDGGASTLFYRRVDDFTLDRSRKVDTYTRPSATYPYYVEDGKTVYKHILLMSKSD